MSAACPENPKDMQEEAFSVFLCCVCAGLGRHEGSYLQYTNVAPRGHLRKKRAEEPVPISYLELLGTTSEKRQCLSQDLEDHFSRKSLDGERVHGEGSSGGEDSRWSVL